MSSWAVLLPLSGFEYDGVEKAMGFAPRIQPDVFSTFWSGGSGWGAFAVEGRKVTLSVLHRELVLESLDLPAMYGFTSIESAALNGSPVAVKRDQAGGRLRLRFSPTLEMREGDRLSLVFAR